MQGQNGTQKVIFVRKKQQISLRIPDSKGAIPIQLDSLVRRKKYYCHSKLGNTILGVTQPISHDEKVSKQSATGY